MSTQAQSVPTVFPKPPGLLRRYLASEGWLLGLLAVLLAASIAAQIISPFIMRHFIDAAQAHRPLFALTRAALLFLSLAVLFQITAVAETYVAELLGWRVTNRMRSDLTRHCLSLDTSFHKTHLPGAMIERIDGDVSTLSNYFSRLVVSVGALRAVSVPANQERLLHSPIVQVLRREMGKGAQPAARSGDEHMKRPGLGVPKGEGIAQVSRVVSGRSGEQRIVRGLVEANQVLADGPADDL